MALNSVQCAEEIMDAMEGLGLNPRNPLNNGTSEKIWQAVAAAILTHIQVNAEVNGVVTGGGSSSGASTEGVVL